MDHIPESTNTTDLDLGLTPPYDFTLAELIFHSVPRYIIWLVGIISNIVLIVTVVRNEVFHSVCYLLMVILACSECLVNSVLIAGHSVSLFWYFNRSYEFNSLALQLFGVLCLFGYNSAFFFTFLISFNRLCSVIYFNKYKEMFSLKRTVIMIVGTYFIIVLLCALVVPGAGIGLYHWQPDAWHFIVEIEKAPLTEIVFLLHQVIAVIAIVIMVTFYVLIIRKLRKISKVRSNKATAGGTSGGEGPSKQEVKLSIQFSLVTVVFVFCWVFLAIYTLVTPLLDDPDTAKWIMVARGVMFGINYSVNPLIYAAVNNRMRRYMKAVLFCSDLATTSPQSSSVKTVRVQKAGSANNA